MAQQAEREDSRAFLDLGGDGRTEATTECGVQTVEGPLDRGQEDERHDSLEDLACDPEDLPSEAPLDVLGPDEEQQEVDAVDEPAKGGAILRLLGRVGRSGDSGRERCRVSRADGRGGFGERAERAGRVNARRDERGERRTVPVQEPELGRHEGREALCDRPLRQVRDLPLDLIRHPPIERETEPVLRRVVGVGETQRASGATGHTTHGGGLEAVGGELLGGGFEDAEAGRLLGGLSH